MIIRIATEGQYRLPDDELERLNELDDAVVEAVDAGDEAEFERRFAALLEHVRNGALVDEGHLGPSDLILPPPDLSVAEAARDFNGDGLIPDPLES